MDVYVLLKLNRHIRSTRIKLLGIWLLHCFGKRYFGLFLDPVLACNLRCKMCYFSDENKRKQLKGVMKETDLSLLANAFFHRALKLQIGCGAEPSLFQHNKELISLGKSCGVPYISMTTNGNLFSYYDLQEFVTAGLNEITLSLHGVKRETYEYFMQGGSFDKFLATMDSLTKIKKQKQNFKVRLNYTVNKDNLEELQSFFSVFGAYSFDILQIRPVQKIGDTVYNDFSWKEIYDAYDAVLEKLKKECIRRNITLLMPQKEDLTKENNNDNTRIAKATYFYLRPNYYWQEDFDLTADTYETYSNRKHIGWQIFKQIFYSNPKKPKSTENTKNAENAEKTEKQYLNYEINQ
ncbi:MAG: radical SAM protein [Bacteroidales bacterium]|jgi:MoaA/NifB/PqqE/SkfB family radical SAM enzyme|nr:radical SAM protein [Bacteroidales bacterium]